MYKGRDTQDDRGRILVEDKGLVDTQKVATIEDTGEDDMNVEEDKSCYMTDEVIAALKDEISTLEDKLLTLRKAKKPHHFTASLLAKRILRIQQMEENDEQFLKSVIWKSFNAPSISLYKCEKIIPIPLDKEIPIGVTTQENFEYHRSIHHHDKGEVRLYGYMLDQDYVVKYPQITWGVYCNREVEIKHHVESKPGEHEMTTPLPAYTCRFCKGTVSYAQGVHYRDGFVCDWCLEMVMVNHESRCIHGKRSETR